MSTQSIMARLEKLEQKAKQRGGRSDWALYILQPGEDEAAKREETLARYRAERGMSEDDPEPNFVSVTFVEP
jgi:hypothetical protein